MSEHGGAAAGGGAGGDSGVIANLLAKISFITDTHGLDHLGHKLEGIKHAVEALVAFRAVEALHVLGERFAGLGESLESASLQTGLTTSELQKLQYAGTQNAVSAEEMTMALTRLGRTMFQAQKGSKQAVATFERLGISKEQLDSFASTKEAFFAVADGVNRLGTQQEKLGVTQQILGRSGSKYLKLFAEGTEEITALGERAVKVGAIISHQSIENLAKFEDSASSLKLVARAFLANVAGTFVPAFTRGMRALEEAWGRNRNVITNTLAELGEVMGLFGASVYLTFQNLSELVHRIIYGGKGIGGSLHGLLEIVKNTLVGIGSSVAGSISQLISNGSLSVFFESLKGLLISVKDVGADIANLFSRLASGLGQLGDVDTNGIDKTTNSLNLLLSVLTGLSDLLGGALKGADRILTGKIFSELMEANAAGSEAFKYRKRLLNTSFIDATGRLVNGLDASANFAAAGPASAGAASFVGPPSPTASNPVQMTSTINVTAAPGMSTEQLSKQIADKQNASFMQMLRESRRDLASPLLF